MKMLLAQQMKAQWVKKAQLMPLLAKLAELAVLVLAALVQQWAPRRLSTTQPSTSVAGRVKIGLPRILIPTSSRPPLRVA